MESNRCRRLARTARGQGRHGRSMMMRNYGTQLLLYPPWKIGRSIMNCSRVSVIAAQKAEHPDWGVTSGLEFEIRGIVISYAASGRQEATYDMRRRHSVFRTKINTVKKTKQ